MKVSYNNFHEELFPGFLHSPSKDNFDLPAFEDAFDTVSLRKFYQEQESNDSQSILHCKKDDSLFDDIDFGFEDNEPLKSPLRFLYDANIGTFPNQDLRNKVSFNLNISRGNLQQDLPFLLNQSSKGLDSHVPLFQPKTNDNFQIFMRSGNMVFSTKTGQEGKESVNDAAKNQMLQKLQVVKGKSFDSTSTEADNFMILLKSKKIFKIEKNTKQDKVVNNLKKKAASSPKSTKTEKSTPKDKQAGSKNGAGKKVASNTNKTGTKQV